MMILTNCSGISVTGGVLGGLLAGFIYLKVKKLSFFYHMRLYALAIPVGHIVGRFGCFLNGDAGGRITTMPWGVKFAVNSVAYSPYTSIPTGSIVHPTQIYEIIGNLVLILFMVFTSSTTALSSNIEKQASRPYAVAFITLNGEVSVENLGWWFSGKVLSQFAGKITGKYFMLGSSVTATVSEGTLTVRPLLGQEQTLNPGESIDMFRCIVYSNTYPEDPHDCQLSVFNAIAFIAY